MFDKYSHALENVFEYFIQVNYVHYLFVLLI